MKCGKCGEEMFRAQLTDGASLFSVRLTNKKKGFLESEKRSAVLCCVCPKCGYLELYAEDPKGLKLN